MICLSVRVDGIERRRCMRLRTVKPNHAGQGLGRTRSPFRTRTPQLLDALENQRAREVAVRRSGAPHRLFTAVTMAQCASQWILFACRWDFVRRPLESTSARCHRLPLGREPRVALTTRKRAAPLERRAAGRLKGSLGPSDTRLHWTDGTGYLGGSFGSFCGLSELGYLGGNFGSFCGLCELGCLGANVGRRRPVCDFGMVFLLLLELNTPTHVRPALKR
jgi:hypothetical protein